MTYLLLRQEEQERPKTSKSEGQERPKTTKSEGPVDGAPVPEDVEGSDEREVAPEEGGAEEKKGAVAEEAKGNPVEEQVPAEQAPQEQAPPDAPPDA